MPRNTRFWQWIVFAFSAGGYAPIVVGGFQHPREINMASYSIWAIVSIMMLYSSYRQKFAGWWMPLGFLVGNIAMLILGFILGGYTFNLGPAEMIGVYGIVTVLSVWVAVGTITKKWSNHILLVGTIITDIISFYPQLKQYLLPHDHPTNLMIIGWCCFAFGAFVNFMLVERLVSKLFMSDAEYKEHYNASKKLPLILEESTFSVENCALVIVTILLMIR
jgi:hypothetical protein